MGFLGGLSQGGRYEAASAILKVVDQQLNKNKDKPEVRAALLEVKEKCREIMDEPSN